MSHEPPVPFEPPLSHPVVGPSACADGASGGTRLPSVALLEAWLWECVTMTRRETAVYVADRIRGMTR